jgi:hypothetical protein
MVAWLGSAGAHEQQEGLLGLLDSMPVVDGSQMDRFPDDEAAAASQRAHGGAGNA